MNDLISRSAAIDAIVSGTIFETPEDLRKCAEKPGTCNGETWIGGANDAIHAIEDMEPVEAIPLEWLTTRMGEELEKAVLIGGEHNALSRSLWNVVEYWRREAKA